MRPFLIDAQIIPSRALNAVPDFTGAAGDPLHAFDMPTLFSGMLDRRVAIAQTQLAENIGALLPGEEASVAHAVPRRRREFAAGRACAHTAMAALGLPSSPLPRGQDRVPIWPQAVVGSITHSDRYAAAAVALRDQGFKSLGIDVEPAEPLQPELWELVFLPRERAWLKAHGDDASGLLARVCYSAKECAFKCQYTLTRSMLGFHDLHVTIDHDRTTFIAEFLQDAFPFRRGSILVGHVRIGHGAIACAMQLGGVPLVD